jgi:two-component system alkaline phosphatase synthesis response regulator PhoP
MSSPSFQQTLFQSALLVEDDANLAVSIRIALRKLGIPTHHVTTLEEARSRIQQSPFDFILLDRNLPDGDGLALCTQLRESSFRGAILILTAAGAVEDRVEGLHCGADDYLPKPFSWPELEARILTLARRREGFSASSTSTAPSNVGLWLLDEGKLRIRGPLGWVTLTPLEFKLAARLIRASGNIVSRNDLLKNVWGFTLLPKTRTVDHFLGRLRKHFEANPEQPRHFLTVRGAGYRFTAQPEQTRSG